MRTFVLIKNTPTHKGTFLGKEFSINRKENDKYGNTRHSF